MFGFVGKKAEGTCMGGRGGAHCLVSVAIWRMDAGGFQPITVHYVGRVQLYIDCPQGHHFPIGEGASDKCKPSSRCRADQLLVRVVALGQRCTEDMFVVIFFRPFLPLPKHVHLLRNLRGDKKMQKSKS